MYVHKSRKSYVTTMFRHSPGMKTSGTSNCGIPLSSVSEERRRTTSAEPSWAIVKFRAPASAELGNDPGGSTLFDRMAHHPNRRREAGAGHEVLVEPVRGAAGAEYPG